MATWTQKLTTANAITDHVASDGTDFYFRSNTTDIYRYNTADDTLTQISNSASWESNTVLATQNTCNLCYFNGTLYVMAVKDPGATGNAHIQVYSYDGSGTSWTRVADYGDAAGDYFPGSIHNDDTYICITMNPLVGLDLAYHSTDGTSWSASTISGLTDPRFIYSISFGNDMRRSIVMNCRDGAAGVGDSHIVQFNAGTWSSVENLGVTNQIWLQSAQLDFYWKRNAVPNYLNTTDFSSYNTPSVPTIVPTREINMPYSFGVIETATPTINFRYWTSGDWGNSESIVADTRVDEVAHLVRMNNGDVYVLLRCSVNDEVWKRDEAIDPPAAAGCRFYLGQAAGALLEKFTLPFAGVAPKAMTLDRPLGNIVFGANAPDTDPVVYSQWPYATGTVTDEAFPETTAITVLKWI